MLQPKLEVPAELRDLTEKAIAQTEQAFRMFFDAANKSVAAAPGPTGAISKHARKLVQATDLQQAMQIQSEFLRSQFTNAGEHMRQMTTGVMSGGDPSGG